MKTLIKSTTIQDNYVASSSDLTFSKCNQSYKKSRISARSRNFINALLSENRNDIKKSLQKLGTC